ncbi:MAG: ParB N-terminal domain-containing protein, partial [Acidimicrobiales bacterium]
VSARLAGALGARRVSTGEAQRAIAAQRGISTLELNRLAELDPTIDNEIDGVFRALAASPEPVVVDSRLAWHFLPASFKVHLVVDPGVGASRVLHRTGHRAEHYESVDHALAGTGERVESERRRFLQTYGVDIFRLVNYDLVVDTTEAPPVAVADAVLARYAGTAPLVGRPALLLAPRRVRGADEGDDGDTVGGAAGADDRLGALVDEIRHHGFTRLEPVVVDYRRPAFSVVHGRRRLRAAVWCAEPLVPAVLRDGAAPRPS